MPTQRLGVLLPYLHNPFWRDIESAYHVLAALFGLQLDIRAPDQPQPSAQAALLEQFFDAPCDAWIINPYTPYNLADTIRNHPDKLVFDVGGKMHSSGIAQECPWYISIPTVDYIAQGAMAGNWLKKHLAPKDNVLLIPGIAQMPNSELRLEGARQVLTEAKIECQTSTPAHFKSGPAANIVQTLLDHNEALPQAIFCANDLMALGVAECLHRVERKKEVLVVGVDGIQRAREALHAGMIDATVTFYTREVSQRALDAVIEYLNHQVKPTGTPIESHLLTRQRF